LDGDEVLILIVFSIVAFIATLSWYAPIFANRAFGRGYKTRIVLGILPIVCFIPAAVFIRATAAHEVRESPGLLTLFIGGEIVVLKIITIAARLLGISVRDDAIERRNPAAAIAICGAAVGATLAYCGANVGEGPTIYTTFAPAILAIVAMIAGWLIHQLAARPAEMITVERDAANGIHLAGLLVSFGLILGRAVAGDWKSVEATISDFGRIAWPIIPLVFVASVVQFALRRSVCRAWFAMSLYVAGAAAWITTRGRP
jgi:hypothetical protein